MRSLPSPDYPGGLVTVALSTVLAVALPGFARYQARQPDPDPAVDADEPAESAAT